MPTPQERRLMAQLTDIQAGMTQAQGRALEATTARDQAEATLRTVREDLDTTLGVLAVLPAPTTEEGEEVMSRYEQLRERYPQKFL